ncbi:cupin domain-containing protein [Jonquetella anthropi]|uniref:hypothetical protein n=1 Tax=Jonquetella anthropi TaxID=428712 RepID=UPI0001B9148D|nr:hypothetical protein [Jonquetella anthropi]EEX47651.1 hypothetical protein GCWU000246_01789 [Jonquetella anthropi E3_33 E1]
MLKIAENQKISCAALLPSGPGRVISQSLWDGESARIAVYALGAGETIGSERHFAVHLIVPLTGSVQVAGETGEASLRPGDLWAVPDGAAYQIGSEAGATVLVAALKEEKEDAH